MAYIYFHVSLATPYSHATLHCSRFPYSPAPLCTASPHQDRLSIHFSFLTTSTVKRVDLFLERKIHRSARHTEHLSLILCSQISKMAPSSPVPKIKPEPVTEHDSPCWLSSFSPLPSVVDHEPTAESMSVEPEPLTESLINDMGHLETESPKGKYLSTFPSHI